MSDPNIPKAQEIRLKSLSDLLRLVVTRMNQTRSAGYVYFGKRGSENLYFLTQAVPGWYDMRGLPITYAVNAEEPETNLIEFKAATDSATESWDFVEHIVTSPNVAYIPIINVETIPEMIL